MAETPESSEHTSIKKRITEFKQEKAQPVNMASFIGNPREPMPEGLPFNLKDYIELVDLTGRVIREDKRGFITSSQAPILERLNINEKEWLILTTQFESRFRSLVGAEKILRKAAEIFGFTRRPGLANCQSLLH